MVKARRLRIRHVNVRSLNTQSRLFVLELMAAGHSVDVLCVSESWLRKKQPSATVRIPGFELPLRDDRVVGRGGGVAVYVRYGVQSNHINCPSSSEFQCVGVNICSSRSSVTVVTAYRPPDSDSKKFADYLDQVLAGLPRVASRNICLVGDFNAKHDSWLSSQTSDIAGHRVLRLPSATAWCRLFPNGPSRPTLLRRCNLT